MQAPLIRSGMIAPLYLGSLALHDSTGLEIPLTTRIYDSRQFLRVRTDYDEVMALPLTDPRMNDDRREIHELNNTEGDWSVQAFLLKEKAAKMPLGKHFHAKKVETFILIEGRANLITAFGEKMLNRSEWPAYGPGDVIVMPAYVAHTFYFQPGSRMLCYSSRAFNPNDIDMIAVDLV